MYMQVRKPLLAIAVAAVALLPVLSVPVEARPPALRRDLRSILQPGDILLIHDKVFDVAIPGHWTHCGIYTGEGTVVESTKYIEWNNIYNMRVVNGVIETPLSKWLEKGELKVVRWVGTGDPVKDARVREYAVRWARSQKGKKYDINWTRKQAESWSPSWYCSEIVWAAYWHAGVAILGQPISITSYKDTGILGKPWGGDFTDRGYLSTFTRQANRAVVEETYPSGAVRLRLESKVYEEKEVWWPPARIEWRNNTLVVVPRIERRIVTRTERYDWVTSWRWVSSGKVEITQWGYDGGKPVPPQSLDDDPLTVTVYYKK